VTRDPFIVFTSNVFAILGLRSLYFVLAGAISYFRYLKVGLSFVLVFIGIKMLLDPHGEESVAGAPEAMWFQFHIPTTISLLVVGGILGVSILFSVVAARRENRGRATGESEDEQELE
jgi:tellurite resistance protein TerC